jgi:copper chaperone CopZ
MNKYIIKIDGMKCGMCESHVNDLFRKNVILKSVKSNHKTGVTTIISNIDLSIDDINKALDNSGYIIEDVKKEEANKTLFGYR